MEIWYGVIVSKFGDCSSKFVGEVAFLKKVCQKKKKNKKERTRAILCFGEARVSYA